MNMFLVRKISARIFSSAAYLTLCVLGWKRKTVEANLDHVSHGNWGKKFDSRGLYKQMLKNLTRHVGELLFRFETYKNLPEDCKAYPCEKDGEIFELAEGAGAVIEKMRQGGIFLTAHYGNYEASGAWLCSLGVPLKASFIPLKPEWLNRHIYNRVRSVKGRPYSLSARSPREFLCQLDGKAPDCNGQRQLFCLLADQDSRISSASKGIFLGQSAKINPLPDFLLRHRPDTPVFFCWIEEIDENAAGGKKRRILHGVEANKTDLPQGRGNCQSIVDGPYRQWLEERIAENPALWYGWTHRRFRSIHPEIYR